MKKTIQEMRDDIYHNYGVDVEDMDSDKMTDLINDLDTLADALADQEAKVEEMKEDLTNTLSRFAEKYKEDFDSIYLFGGDIALVEDNDIDFDE